jgi:hypothetical protein
MKAYTIAALRVIVLSLWDPSLWQHSSETRGSQASAKSLLSEASCSTTPSSVVLETQLPKARP